MKALTIFRHAKAERPDAHPQDFDRPLTARGRKDAERMSHIIAAITPGVDCIISSTAVRAAQTASHLAATLDDANAPLWAESAYLASAETLLELLRDAPQDAAHVVLVGHNPGMEELAALLCTGATNGAMLRLPTAGIAHLLLDIGRWQQIRAAGAELQLLATPKFLP
jgi:phosphohistidine phosphatase